jgi:hypothetical protein
MSVSFEGGPLLVMVVNILLGLKVLLLALFELPSLQQLLIRTTAIQTHQVHILTGLLLSRGQELLQHLFVHHELERDFALVIVLLVRFDEMVQDFCAFFDDEGDGPCEEIHEVGQ